MTENISDHNLPAQIAFTASAHHDGWTVERQRGFCEVLAQCGYVERAANAVGMTRQGAYAFRQRSAGRAFALAWDAALLLARQRLVDDAYELAFEGTVERIYRDGKLFQEKRKRDPRMLLTTIERLGKKAALGSAPVQAVAQDFQVFLDAMDAEGRGASGATGNFMECRADWGGALDRPELKAVSGQLRKAALDAPPALRQLEDRTSD